MNSFTQRTSALRARSALTFTGALAAALLLATPGAYAAAPDNDEIGEAVVVSTVPYTASTDTSEATVSTGDSGCGAATVWYTFTPSDDGTYQFDTIGSDYDTTLAVLIGTPGNLTVLYCNDDAFGGVQSGLRLDLTAGTTYYIEAGTCCGGDVGQVGPGGSLVVNVSLAQDAFEAEITVDRATITGPGTATVSGTLTCTGENLVWIDGVLRQVQGLDIATGYFYVESGIACSDEQTTWTAAVDVWSRVLLPKRATVSATVYWCDDFNFCDSSSVTRTIKVTRR